MSNQQSTRRKSTTTRSTRLLTWEELTWRINKLYRWTRLLTWQKSTWRINNLEWMDPASHLTTINLENQQPCTDGPRLSISNQLRTRIDQNGEQMLRRCQQPCMEATTYVHQCQNNQWSTPWNGWIKLLPWQLQSTNNSIVNNLVQLDQASLGYDCFVWYSDDVEKANPCTDSPNISNHNNQPRSTTLYGWIQTQKINNIVWLDLNSED